MFTFQCIAEPIQCRGFMPYLQQQVLLDKAENCLLVLLQLSCTPTNAHIMQFHATIIRQYELYE